jgi:hypothetical protein
MYGCSPPENSDNSAFNLLMRELQRSSHIAWQSFTSLRKAL